MYGEQLKTLSVGQRIMAVDNGIIKWKGTVCHVYGEGNFANFADVDRDDLVNGCG